METYILKEFYFLKAFLRLLDNQYATNDKSQKSRVVGVGKFRG